MAAGALTAFWLAVLALVLPYVLSQRPVETASANAGKGGAKGPGRASRSIELAFAGDVTLGSRYGSPPEGGRPLFAAVRDPIREADLAIANLEGTLSAGGAPKCAEEGDGCFSFQAPPENAGALRWAGFDAVSLANNHAFDFGDAGLEQTRSALEEHGVGHIGAPGQIALLRARGVRVALVGFAPYPWTNDVDDHAGVADLVARASEEADVVVAIAHLGAEGTDQRRVPAGAETYLGERRGDTRAFAHAAAEAGASLVVASGPHVLRGMEVHEGSLIAYSLGNFAGWSNFSLEGVLGESALLTVRVTANGRPREGKVVPLRLGEPGIPAGDEDRTAIETIDELGRRDFGSAAVRVDGRGEFRIRGG